VELTVLINGAAGVVAALGRLMSDGRADVRGMITSIDPAARSLTIGAILVMVPGTAEIKERGIARAFGDLALQQRVHVEGIVSGSAITAREVEIEDERDDDDNGDDDEDDAEFTGTVTAIRGDCPALSLTVGGRSVRTNGSTSFLRTTCSTLAVGAIVEVEGATQPDGSVLAQKVQLEDDDEDDDEDEDDEDDEDEAEFRGTVALVGGSCPSLTMTVGGRAVRTNGSTTFERGVCDDVRTGLLLQVKGVANADGSVTATRVRFED